MKYVLLVFALIVILNPIIARKHYRFYLLMVLLLLTALAYFVVPSPSMDLYRYLEHMNFFEHMGWRWTMRNYGSSNPLATVAMYALAQFHNDHLLAAVAVFITYGCSFVLFAKAAKRYEASYADMNFAFVFLMLNMNYCYVIDVVRIYIAYAIFALFLYIDVIEKKYRPLCFAVYIGLCYFHYAIVLFVLLRIIFFFTRKLRGVLSVLAAFGIPLVLYIAYRVAFFFTGGNVVLSVLSDRIDKYQEYEVFGIWQFLASVVRVLFLLAIMVVAVEFAKQITKRNNTDGIKNKRNDSIRVYEYSTLLIYISASVFTFITNYQYVLRTPYFIQILASAPLLYIFTNQRKEQLKRLQIMELIVLAESLSHFIYLLIYVYGNLSFEFVL